MRHRKTEPVKVFLISSFLFLLACNPLRAQGLSGELEIGTDGKGHPFLSQYLFYDDKKLNVLVRYFWVNGNLNRGELAIGPTFKFGRTTLKLQFGGTTDKEVMISSTVFTKLAGHGILYIPALRLSTSYKTNTLYQKLFLSLTKKGSWQIQFRAEHFQIGKHQAFLRTGPELQHEISRRVIIFVAPFYDPINKGFGGNSGFRF